MGITSSTKMLMCVAPITMILAAVMAGTAYATPISFTPGTYTFTTSATGEYAIDAVGAQGGNPFGGTGGLGANASGLYSLSAGEVLGIVVGGLGTSYGTSSGGGGGSFVYVTGTNALLVAGGGGGGTYDRGPNGGNASTVSSALSESSGNVAGVDGSDGSCCGTISSTGAGGLSYVDISAVDGYVGDASITLATGGGNGRVTISPVSAVPEPGSIALLATGAALLGWLRRGRSSKAVFAG